ADPWLRLAVLSSSADRADRLFAAILRDDCSTDEVALLAQLAAIVGARNRADEIERVLVLLATAHRRKPMQRDLFVGLGDGVLRTGKTLNTVKMPPAAREVFDQLLRQAADTAANERATSSERTAAIQMLAHAP